MKNTNNMSIEQILELQLKDLDLSVGTYNDLRSAGLNTIRKIIRYSENDLRLTVLLGRKTVEEIKDRIASFNIPELHLDMSENEINCLFHSLMLEPDNLTQEDKEKLEKMEAFARQKEEDAKKAEFMVAKAKEYRDMSSEAIRRKQVALAELQELCQEQERLQNESEQLDAQIALVAAKLGFENIESDSEMVNDENHSRKL